MKLSQRRMSAPSVGAILATRQGSLLLALLCAVCAAGVLIFALGRYKTNVVQPVPQATVLVATGEITKGMSGTQIVAQKLYKVTPVLSTQITPGAITDAAGLGSETAAADILPGQQLTTSDFSELAAVSLALPHNQRALEINASGASGAVDITNPDSRVDVYGVPKGATDSSYVLIATDVHVLKPATATPVTIGNQSVAGSTLVLQVKPALIETLLDATNLYLVLRPGKSGATPATPPTPTVTTLTTTGAS